MPMQPVIELLDSHKVRYVSIHHSVAFTAREVAQSIHLPARLLAKVVIVVIDNRLAMAVVPATRDVDFDLLKTAAQANSARIAREAEFAGRFRGSEPGMTPPFGPLFGVEAYVDQSLSEDQYIAFNAGTRTDVVVMDFKDYRRLAHPKMVDIVLEPATTRH